MSNIATIHEAGNWYAGYVGVASTFVAAKPVAYFVVVHDANTAAVISTDGYVWDRTTTSFVPANSVTGFDGYFRVASSEPMTFLSNTDFNRVMDQASPVTDKDRRGLVDNETAKILARLVAYSNINAIVLPKLIRGEGL